MGGHIPIPKIEDFEDDDEGGDDDEENIFDGSGLGSIINTLNIFNVSGPSQKNPELVPTTTSLQSTTPSSKITELHSPLTTTSPKNNAHHRNKSHCLGPTIYFFYFIIMPTVLLFNISK